MYPLDVVKTRIQLQTGKGTGADHYNGMVDCFRKIVKNEGYIHYCYGVYVEADLVVSHDYTAVSKLLSSWRPRKEPPSLLPTTSGGNFIATYSEWPR
jgi:hypothetical protein